MTGDRHDHKGLLKEVHISKLLKDISLDELLMKCRSKISYIQCNKSNRTRFDIKFYKLLNSKKKSIYYFRTYIGNYKNKVRSSEHENCYK